MRASGLVSEPMDATLYQSRAIPESQWPTVREVMLKEGWEYLPARAGVVYVRKHVSGPRNTSEGWRSE